MLEPQENRSVPISAEADSIIRAEPLLPVFEAVENALLTNEALKNDLRNVPRWKRYELTEGVSEEFEDTNLLGHAFSTLRIAQRLTKLDLAEQNITPSDALRLWIVALIHDFGEMGEGDLNFIRKKAGGNTEELERIYFHQKKAEWFPSMDQESLTILSDLYDQVALAGDKSSGLPLRFNQIEEVGYLSHALDMFEGKPEKIDWHLLCSSVMHYHIGKIFRYVEQHAATAIVLGEKVESLEQLIEFQAGQVEAVREHLQREFEFEGRAYATDDCRLDLDGWRKVVLKLKR